MRQIYLIRIDMYGNICKEHNIKRIIHLLAKLEKRTILSDNIVIYIANMAFQRTLSY
jgi:hypothetical protein